jgi:four helix bundle protein
VNGAWDKGHGERDKPGNRIKMELEYKDGLDKLQFYKWSLELWDLFWKEDSDVLMQDLRGKEIARQLTRSIYSISANIEEGYGRGFGKEYPQFLRISRGSAKETKGGYYKSRFLLSESAVNHRMELSSKIIGAITKTLSTLANRK